MTDRNRNVPTAGVSEGTSKDGRSAKSRQKVTIAEVARLAGVSTAVLWQIIAKLVRLGLIESADGDVGFVGRPFADAVRNEFAKAVGPISHILLQKTAAEMDIALPKIPAEQATELVNRLVAQIPDEKSRAQFRHTLLKEI